MIYFTNTLNGTTHNALCGILWLSSATILTNDSYLMGNLYHLIIYSSQCAYENYCKTLIFRCILISCFWSLEKIRGILISRFCCLPVHRWTSIFSAPFRCGFNTPNLIVCRCNICTFFNSFFHYHGLADPKLYLFQPAKIVYIYNEDFGILCRWDFGDGHILSLQV